MVEVIHEFGDLCSSIEKLSHKQITVQIEFPTDDFPKETAERLEIISRCDKYTHAIKVKDQMLWKALQEKDQLQEKLSEERKLTQEYAQEVATWAQTTQNLLLDMNQKNAENERLSTKVRELQQLLRKHNIYSDFD
jgi:GTP-sensing pleiotropic transcriptional regulator CodY